MTIEKNTKNILQHEESTFTTITNETLNGIHHTGALGVYCYLASKPAGWNICKKHLQNHFNCGREHIDTCFTYLKNIGAIETNSDRNEKGQIISWHTVLKRKLHASTQENQNTGNPYCGDLGSSKNQNTGFPLSGYSAPINNINKQIKENNNNIGISNCGKKIPVDNFTETCITQNNDYSNFDAEIAGNEKPDYLSNYELPSKTNPKLVENKRESNKPDYCYNQPKIKPISKKTNQFDINNLLANNIYQIPEQAVHDWVENRKKKRAPLTKTSWDRINKELGKCKAGGIDPIDAFETMVAHGWQAMKVEWFINQGQKKPSIAYYPTASQRSADDEAIRKREAEWARRKQEEVKDSKQFNAIVRKSNHVPLKNLLGW